MSTGSDSSNGNPQLLGPFVVGDDDDMQVAPFLSSSSQLVSLSVNLCRSVFVIV